MKRIVLVGLAAFIIVIGANDASAQVGCNYQCSGSAVQQQCVKAPNAGQCDAARRAANLHSSCRYQGFSSPPAPMCVEVQGMTPPTPAVGGPLLAKWGITQVKDQVQNKANRLNFVIERIQPGEGPFKYGEAVLIRTADGDAYLGMEQRQVFAKWGTTQAWTEQFQRDKFTSLTLERPDRSDGTIKTGESFIIKTTNGDNYFGIERGDQVLAQWSYPLAKDPNNGRAKYTYFVLYKASGEGPISPGDQVSIRTNYGDRYWGAPVQR